MDVILFISDEHMKSRNFLRDLAKDLREKNIPFRFEKEKLSIETKFCKIICQSINSHGFRHSHRKVYYYIKCSAVKDIDEIISVKLDAKEIDSWEQIIELLGGGLCQ